MLCVIPELYFRYCSKQIQPFSNFDRNCISSGQNRNKLLILTSTLQDVIGKKKLSRKAVVLFELVDWVNIK